MAGIALWSVVAGYALLIAAMVAARRSAMRALVAAAAAVLLARAVVVTHDRAEAICAGLLLLACLLQLAHRLYERRSVTFTDEERGVIDGLVAGLSQSRARHLIDQGVWLAGKAGDTLTREGEPVTQLYYLAEGEARVMSGGREVGRCRAGDLVGEISILSGDPASATVVLDGSARFWCVSADTLRPYVEVNDDIRRALEQGIARALKAKLHASNRAIAGQEGAPAG